MFLLICIRGEAAARAYVTQLIESALSAALTCHGGLISVTVGAKTGIPVNGDRLVWVI
jgi:hypothetical protein